MTMEKESIRESSRLGLYVMILLVIVFISGWKITL
nr:MAG TPA: hypothetical protein [Caudoviricetes sp.]